MFPKKKKVRQGKSPHTCTLAVEFVGYVLRAMRGPSAILDEYDYDLLPPEASKSGRGQRRTILLQGIYHVVDDCFGFSASITFWQRYAGELGWDCACATVRTKSFEYQMISQGAVGGGYRTHRYEHTYKLLWRRKKAPWRLGLPMCATVYHFSVREIEKRYDD